MKDSTACPDLVEYPRPGPHLRSCSRCRGELAAAQALHREFSEYVGVEELGMRVAAAASAERARSSSATRVWRGKRLGTGWQLLAAALVLVSIAAVAATHPAMKLLWHSSRGSQEDSGPSPSAPPHVASPLEGRAPPASKVAEHADEAPAEPSLDDSSKAPPAEASPALPSSSSPARIVSGSAAGDAPSTARALFASANMARRDGDGSRASALYRELQRQYPTSAEALVSRVSFGRLLLDRLGDPARALAQFDGYLAQTAQTTLAEEALFGRASALAKLGRSDAERETWRTLLTRYPSSVYADRARVRMRSDP